MKTLVALFVIGLLTLTTTAVKADSYITQTNVNLGTLGSHDGNVFYFNLKQGFTTTCQYGLIYCPSGSPDCKNRMAIALTAKSLDRSVEVRYTHQTATNACTLGLISIN